MTEAEKSLMGPQAKKVLQGMWDVLASLTSGLRSAFKAGYHDGMSRWEARRK